MSFPALGLSERNHFILGENAYWSTGKAIPLPSFVCTIVCLSSTFPRSPSSRQAELDPESFPDALLGGSIAEVIVSCESEMAQEDRGLKA